MKILLMGATGQLGSELKISLMNIGHVVCSYADFTELAAVRAAVILNDPDIIVNAAAYTAVDLAETERDKADLINHLAVAVLAEAAKEVGAVIVHYSTDYVYPGQGDIPIHEEDQTYALNFYGLSKLTGDEALKASGVPHIIFRTSWLYGNANRPNFVATMIRLFKNREVVNVVNDQHGSPTSARMLADLTAQILAQAITYGFFDFFTKHTGVYHATNSGYASWYRFALEILKEAKDVMDLQVKEINPIPTTAYPQPARRPLNSRLSLEKLVSTFNLTPPEWDVSFGVMFREIYKPKIGNQK